MALATSNVRSQIVKHLNRIVCQTGIRAIPAPPSSQIGYSCLLGLLISLYGGQVYAASLDELNQCADSLSAGTSKALSTARTAYGNSVAAIPEEINAQINSLEPQNNNMQSELEKLHNMDIAIRVDASNLESDSNQEKARDADIHSQQQQLETEKQNLVDKLNAFQPAVDQHNAHPCEAPLNNPSICNSYNDEAARGNQYIANLQKQINDIQARLDQLDKEENDLGPTVISLASRQNWLDQRSAALANQTNEDVSVCQLANEQALALVELLQNPPSTHESSVREPSQFTKDFVTDALVEKGKDVLEAAGYGTLADSSGQVITFEDFMAEAMDERASQVADQTYLLGDYAKALKQMRAQGTLSPGDPGYDAVEAMVRRTNNDLPTSRIGFTLQSVLGQAEDLQQIAASCARYVSRVTGNTAQTILSAAIDKNASSAGGQEFFDKAQLSVSPASLGDSAVQFLTLSSGQVQKSRQSAAVVSGDGSGP